MTVRDEEESVYSKLHTAQFQLKKAIDRGDMFKSKADQLFQQRASVMEKLDRREEYVLAHLADKFWGDTLDSVLDMNFEPIKNKMKDIMTAAFLSQDFEIQCKKGVFQIYPSMGLWAFDKEDEWIDGKTFDLEDMLVKWAIGWGEYKKIAQWLRGVADEIEEEAKLH